MKNAIHRAYDMPGKVLLFLLFLFIGGYDAYAQLAGYSYKKLISIDHSNVSGTSDLTNFPLLFSLTDPNLRTTGNGGHVESANGYDIAFTSSDGTTQLDHEIQYYDGGAAGGEYIAWVRIPVLSATADTDIYIYYGNSSITSDPSTSDTWDSDYEVVLHLQESGSGVDNEYKDSSGNGHHGTGGGVVGSGNATDSPSRVAGKFGYAQDFEDADDDHIMVLSTDESSWSQLTIQVWFNNDDNGDDRIWGKNWGTGDEDQSYFLGQDGNGTKHRFCTDAACQTDGHINGSNVPWATGNWHFAVMTWDNTLDSLWVYEEGVLVHQEAIVGTTIKADARELVIGSNYVTNRDFDGKIQEARLSKIKRSDDWIATEYSNQDDPSSFYRVGGESSTAEVSGYSYRKQFKIDHSNVYGSANHIDFPFLVSVTDPDLRTTGNGGKVIHANGYDIVFTAANGRNLLDHEIEKYDAATGEFIAWVRIPSLDYDEDTDIYMYYGNSSVSTDLSTSTTWDDYYKSVWHLNESVTDEQTTGTHYDATNNGNNGTQYGNDDVAAKIGTGQDLDGSDEYITIGIPSLTNAVTVSGWIRHDAMSGNIERYIDLGNEVTIRYDGMNGPGQLNFYVRDSDNTPYHMRSNNALSATTWHYVVGTYDGNMQKMFIDGNELSSQVLGITLASTGGSHRLSHDIEDLNGIIDEARVSSIARSADWIKTEYYNQFDPSAFFSIGGEMSTAEVKGYSFKKLISIDHNEVYGSEDLVDFPFLVSVTDTDLRTTGNGGNVTNANGYDITFTAADGMTVLDYEVEKYDATTGEFIAWVRIPLLDYNDDTDIYLFYGNSSVSTDPSTSDTWDPNYQGVWHLAESSSGGADDFKDATTNGRHMQGWLGAAASTPAQASARIGHGQSFDGGDGIESSTGYLGVLGTSSRTMSAWVQLTATTQNVTVFAYGDNVGGNGEKWQARSSDGAPYDAQLLVTGGTHYGNTTGLNDGNWHYLVWTLEDDGSPNLNETDVYVDGIDDGFSSTASIAINTQAGLVWRIGVALNTGARWVGKIDEVRISNTVRSADWIKTEYYNQKDPSSTFSISGEMANTEVSGYGYFKTITIDNTLVYGSENHINFPLLVNHADLDLRTNANGGYVTSSNGYDIAFTASDGRILLDHEIESYDAATGKYVAWVRIPSLDYNDDTQIYMYYGNSSVTTDPSTTGTWNPDYQAVWHLDENGDGTLDEYKDATTNANHAQGGNGNAVDTPVKATGRIGNGQDFDETTDFIGISKVEDDVDITKGTISFWMTLDPSSANNSPIELMADADNRILVWWDDASDQMNFTYRAGADLEEVTTSTEISENFAWHYATMTWDIAADEFKGYVDGVQVGSTQTGLGTWSGTFTGDAAIGSSGWPAHNFNWNGVIDEARVSSIARSSDWIKTEYYNQNDPSTFYTVSPAVQAFAPGGVDTNLSLWLKADAGVKNGVLTATDGQDVNSWEDQSGKRLNDATDAQYDAPTYRNNTSDNINYNPVLDFDGTDDGLDLNSDYIYSTGTGSQDGMTWFAIVQPDITADTKVRQFIFDFGYFANTGYGLYYSEHNLGQYTPVDHGGGHGSTNHTRGTQTTLNTVVIDFGNQQDVYWDGAGTAALTGAITTTALTTTQITESPIATGGGSGPFTIGHQSKNFALANDDGRMLDGSIAELIGYNKVLSAAERNKVETYLAIKYGITLDNSGGGSEGNYTASDGTVLWDVSANSLYHNDVTGIGRDDESALDQQKSLSANSDAMAIMDKEASFGTDMNFIMWGNNNESATTTNNGAHPKYRNKLERIWKVAVTGAPGTVTVRLILANSGAISDYGLHVDSDTDFSSGATNYIASTISGDTITFENVDFSDGDYFTLGSEPKGPGGIYSDLRLWLKADAGTTGSPTVTSWYDQTIYNWYFMGLGNPQLNSTLNFNAAIDFNGSNFFRANSTSVLNGGNNHYTTFAVIVPDDVSTQRSFIGRFGVFTGSSFYHTNSGALGAFHSLTDIFGGGETLSNGMPSISAIRYDDVGGLDNITIVNGNQFVDNSPSNATNHGLFELEIGGDLEHTNFDGRIAEVSIYQRALSDSEIKQVETYLAIRYGITLDNTGGGTNGDYIASDASLLWDADVNGTYHNDIAGIGRDDNSALDQQKSLSVNSDGMVIMDKGGAFSNDLDFILWGNDNGDTTITTTDLEPSTNSRLTRKWKVAVNGTPGTVTVRVIYTGNSGTAADYILHVDANGTFATGATNYVGSSISGDTITFANVSFADGNYFTVGDVVLEVATFTIDAIADANVDENAAYTSVTPNLSGDTPIGTVTYTLGGVDDGAFTIDGATGVVSMIARDFEAPADANSDNVYQVEITATDENGNDATQAWTVTIDNVVEVANFTIDAVSDANVNENSTYSSAAQSLSGDAPIGTVTYSISGGTDAAAFTINAGTGVVSMIARDFESPADANTDNIYEVEITATDDDLNSDTEVWNVTVDDVLEVANFTINPISNVSINENILYTSVIPALSGDTPIGTVTYTLGGVDAGAFTINGATGVVSLAARNFESPTDANTDNIYQVQIIATDDDNNFNTETWTVTVDDVVEGANFTIDAVSDANVNENSAYSSAAQSLSGDVPIGNVTYSIVGGTDAGSFTINGTTGVVSMVARDYEGPADANTDNVYQVQIRAIDDDGNNDIEIWTVTVDDVVEVANFTIDAVSDANINENAAYSSAAQSLSGDAPIGTVTYTISGGTDMGAFTINGTTGVVGMVARDFESPADANTDNSYQVEITATDADGNDATQTWTVTVDDVVEVANFTIDPVSDANVNENFAYSSAAQNLSGDTPIGNITYSIVGGTDGAAFTINGATGAVSMVARDFESPADANTDNVYEVQIRAMDDDGNQDTEIWTVTVDDVVEVANFTIDAVSDANVNENSAYSSAAQSLSGDAPIGTVTYTISGGTDMGAFTINGSTGVVSMVARDFESPADANSDNSYQVDITATDADGNEASQAWTVTVDDVIEVANFTIDAVSDANVNENSAYSSAAQSLSGDAPIGTVTYSISGGTDMGAFTINPGTGVVSMIARDFESPADANTDNVYEIEITATDSDTNSDTEIWTVTVDDVVEVANFTIDAVSDANVNENAAYSSAAQSLSGDAPIGTVTFTISGGTDMGAFTINPGTGVVSMVARDFEAPADADTDNVYQLEITATDSDSNSDTETWAVTVDDVLEVANFTIDAVSDANVNENSAYSSAAQSLSGDAPIGTVSYTISGGTDMGSFMINPGTGAVSMVARNFEAPADADTDNVYQLEITATDSDSNSDTETWTVTVDDVVEVANFTIDAVSDANVNENSAYSSAAQGLSGDAPIGTITYSISGGTDMGSFTINSGTGAVSMVARNFEAPADADTDNVYEIEITATDSDSNSDTETWTVTVDDAVEVANFTIDAVSDANVNENSAYSSAAQSLSGDAPIGTVTFTISGGTDMGAFTINPGTGVVSMIARDFEAPADANTDNIYEVEITATDSDGNADTETWTLTIDDVAEVANFTINAVSDANVNENSAYSSAAQSLSGDAPIGTVTFTISGGTDMGAFTINPGTGVVSMIARDFEAPADANTDNVYELEITATDSDANSDSETWTVTVDDVVEVANFTIDAVSDANVNENSAYSSTAQSLSGDAPIGTITYSISGGTDMGSFTINPGTGVVSMIARNFESPADANTDNVYEVEITATDADGNNDTETWTVTVDDVAEVANFTIDAVSDANVNENSAYSSAAQSLSGDAPIGTVTFTISGGTDMGSFTINSGTGVVSMVARDFEAPADANTDNVYEVEITATDSDGNDDTETWTVTVDNLVETASFVIDAIADANVNENSAYASVTPNITGAYIGSITYTISGGTDMGSFTINPGTGVVSMIARDFEAPTDSNTDNVYQVEITATDDDLNSDTETWTVTVDDVAEVANFTIDAVSDANVNENSAYSSLAQSLSGDAPIGIVTYSISGGTDMGSFTINPATGVVSMVARDFEAPVDANTDNIYEIEITATDDDLNSDTETWTVTVDDVVEVANFTIDAFSDANINENSAYSSAAQSLSGDAPIGTVTYSISGGTDMGSFTVNPATGVVSMVARDFEAPADANTDNVYEIEITATDDDLNSDTETWTVTVDDVVEVANFTIDAVSDASVNENSAYSSAAQSLSGDAPIGTVTYSISGGTDVGSFTINPASGVVSMIARDFESPADANTDNVYEIEITATDDDLNSDTETWTVTVDDVAEVANFTIDAVSDVNVNENSAYSSAAQSLSGDAPIGTVTFTISGGTDMGAFTINPGTGVVSMIARNFEAPADANTDNVYELEITATDSDSNSDTETWIVMVDDVVEVANFTIDAVSDANVNENSAYTSVTPNLSGDAPIGTVTYTISGGTDATAFTINSGSGVVSMIARDFEAPADANSDNAYEVEITATDDDLNSDTETWTVTVDDMAEVANFTIDAIADANVNENSSFASLTPSLSGDAPIGSVVYTISGGIDAAAFTIDGITGVVSMIARDYEAPLDVNTDNVYELEITATDDDSNSDTETFSVTIDDVIEVLSITIDAMANVTIDENIAYTSVAPNVSSTYIGSISYSITGGADAAAFTINSGSGVVNMIARDYESPVDANADNTFEVEITATDEDGNNDTEYWTVTIADVNDNRPVITATDRSIAEGTTAVETVSATDADAGDSQTYSITGTDAGLFTMNSITGELAFTAAPDFEAPGDAGADNGYDLTVTVTDGGGNTDTQAITVTVTNINDNSPVLTANDQTIVEGTAVVATVTSTDADVGDAPTFTIAGADAALFTMDPASGALTFTTAPDFEVPGDAGADNVYNLTVTVTDGIGNTDSQAITVTVTDVNDEMPVLTIKSVSIDEETTAVGTATATDADAGDTQTYSISGTDAALFAIDAVTGVLAFVVVPDFEAPGDANGDNIYEVDVTVTDNGSNTDTQSITVTILDVPSVPPVADDDTATVNEGGTVTIDIVDGDSDPDGTLDLSSILISNITNGNVADNGDGTVDFNHDGSETSTASFNYTIQDNEGIASNQATVSVTVTPVNDVPEVVDDVGSTDEGQVLNGPSLLSNDSDAEGEPLTINTTPIDDVDNGSLIIQPDGTYTYTPNAGYFGTDSFTYEVCDGQGGCATAQVLITINSLDEDGDGILNVDEGTVDTDGDGTPDYQDIDSDNDGILDAEEGNIDTDGDGIPDFRDPDSDNDGFSDLMETNADCDMDGTPNYLDTDRCGLVIPRGFSPNGDGKHDQWIIRGIEMYPHNTVKVFNRWGNMVYEARGYDNSEIVWVGQSEGRLRVGLDEVTDGSYFYLIELGDSGEPLSGYVIINR